MFQNSPLGNLTPFYGHWINFSKVRNISPDNDKLVVYFNDGSVITVNTNPVINNTFKSPYTKIEWKYINDAKLEFPA